MGEESKILERTLGFVRIKPMTKEYPPTLLIAVSMYVGLFTIAPMAVFEMMGFFGNNQIFNLSQMGTEAILGLLYMAIFSSIVAYISYQKAIKLVKVSDMAFFHYLSPLFTLPVAYALLGEVPNKFVVVGSVFIAIGVYIAEIKNNKY
jgi:drug/metabolite transporter (DMT)-like permease